MYVGVIPKVVALDDAQHSIPHVCGGDPNWFVVGSHPQLYSPCMWG